MVLPILRGTKVRPMGEGKPPGIPKTFALQSTQQEKSPSQQDLSFYILLYFFDQGGQ